MDNKNFVIGLYGIIGSGKTIASEFLVNNMKFTKLAFADPIKEACKSIFNFSKIQMSDRQEKEKIDPRYGVSPRQAFRLIGHDCLRSTVGPDIWVKNMEDRIYNINKNISATKNIIVDDVRYQNEINFIEHYQNGFVIPIIRPNNPFEVHAVHASDTQQINIKKTDVIIYNDAGIAELKVKILFMLYDLKFLKKEAFHKTLDILNNRMINVLK